MGLRSQRLGGGVLGAKLLRNLNFIIELFKLIYLFNAPNQRILQLYP